MILEEDGADDVDEKYFKEKDLKNHLEAGPDLNKDETVLDRSDKDDGADPETDDAEGYKTLKLKKLMRDNQVMRATGCPFGI